MQKKMVRNKLWLQPSFQTLYLVVIVDVVPKYVPPTLEKQVGNAVPQDAPVNEDEVDNNDDMETEEPNVVTVRMHWV